MPAGHTGLHHRGAVHRLASQEVQPAEGKGLKVLARDQLPEEAIPAVRALSLSSGARAGAVPGEGGDCRK